MKSEWEWVYAYDSVCRKINKDFDEMFEQKRKDSDERDVRIIAKIKWGVCCTYRANCLKLY